MSSTLRAEQRAETRRGLLDTSRRLFAAKGYSAVGLSEIVAAAGVTKGALYHNFESKSALFGEVVAGIQHEVGARVDAAASSEPDTWGQLVVGCEAFLATCADPEIQRILLVDGPAVLGWHEWRAMDARNSVRHLREVLTLLIEEGVLAPQPIEPLTHLLSGAMNEAALWLATTDDPNALAETSATLRNMLTALRAAGVGVAADPATTVVARSTVVT